jgi:hypothetical protein
MKIDIMTLKDKIINSYNVQRSKRKLNDTQKINLLFDIILEFIIKYKWTYFPDGHAYDAYFILDCTSYYGLPVNCFELSDLFIALCKEVGFNDADTFVYKYKPSSKIGQQLYEKNSESRYKFQCFDEQFTCVDNQVCFVQHCVAKVNNRFYDLVFSSAYQQMDAPYDIDPFAKVFSLIHSNNEMEALHILETSDGIDLEQTFEGMSLLHTAAQSNFINIVSFLLNKGADANKWSKANPPQVPLNYVTDVNSELFILLSKHTDPLILENIKRNLAMPHFYDAVNVINCNGSINEFSEAMRGIDIDSKYGVMGWTLLHFAVLAKNLRIAEFLLEQGASANIKDAYSFCPLQYVDKSNLSMYKLLYYRTEKTESASEKVELTNKLSPSNSINEPEFALDMSNKIEAHERIFSRQQNIQTSGIMDISMYVLSGFITIVGCAAVATAFIVLNAATFSTAGLVVAGLGATSILAGIGIFGTEIYKNKSTTSNEFLEDIAHCSF